MKKTLIIIMTCIFIITGSIIPVFAENTSANINAADVNWEQGIINGNNYKITYNHPAGLPNFIIFNLQSSSTFGQVFIMYYSNDTIFRDTIFNINSGMYMVSDIAWQSYMSPYKEPTIQKAKLTVFGETPSETWGKNFTLWNIDSLKSWTGYEHPPGEIIADSGNIEQLETMYYEWYEEQYGTEPPAAGQEPEEPEEDKNILKILKDILEALTHPRDAGFLTGIKQGIENELQGNQFYQGLAGIINTIQEILTKDYTKPNNFYEDNPFKLKINGIAMPSKNGSGYYIDNRFNMELNPLNSKNMRWYFGDYTNMSGAYLMVDGSPAVKAITDPIISAILWISLGIGLFKNLTRILDGDFASVGKIMLKDNSKTKTKNEKKDNNEKGE